MPPWETIQPVIVRCAVCGGEFAAKRSNARYCSGRCRDRDRSSRSYDSDYRRDYYARTKAIRGVRDREAARQRATNLRAWLSEYKAAVGCIDCGFSDPRALDFDHVSGTKDRNVCFAKSIAQAEAEIDKCVVRCANCHRIRTWERLQERQPIPL